MNFLRHVVSECDPGKINKMRYLRAPNTKTGVRAILDLENYYRRFIKGFSSIVEPMQRLIHKYVDFSWGGREQTALDKHKEAFCSAPILVYPHHEGEPIVDTDASN